MKRFAILTVALILAAFILACAPKEKEPAIEETITSGYRTYYKMSDGTWATDAHTYKYRLEISGRMTNAAKDSTFVYLSNIETITFDRAWKAAGLSSNMEDYFSAEEAVLVELR